MKKLMIFFLFLFTIPTSVLYASEEVYLGGDSIGIIANYDGVYISGTTNIKVNNTTYNNDEYVKIGDLIIEINQNRIHNLQDFYNCIHTFKDTTVIPIKIIRNNQKLQTKLHIIHIDGNNETGLYLKDRITGIGTLTYITKDTNIFGCLGHSISNENNTYLQKGTLHEATINSISKAKTNQPGEKIGRIHYDTVIGNITQNTQTGVYGTMLPPFNKSTILTANIDEIKIDSASFLTVLHETEIKEIAIQITSYDYNTNTFEFNVTDKNFINLYGGITHGMSGSPIIQDGKLVGAVTHVLVNDPTRGYGIFIENMLDAAG